MITSDPPFKYDNARFITVTLKTSSEKLDIRVFVILNCLFLFAGSFHKWLAHFSFFKSNREIIRIKQFSDSEKRRYLPQWNPHFLIRLKLQCEGCSRCKSFIAIFAWRVTWNNAYSQFNYIWSMYRPGQVKKRDNFRLRRVFIYLLLMCRSCLVQICSNRSERGGGIINLRGVFAKNERGYRLKAIKKRFWSLLILLLSVASIRRKLLKTSHTK